MPAPLPGRYIEKGRKRGCSSIVEGDHSGNGQILLVPFILFPVYHLFFRAFLLIHSAATCLRPRHLGNGRLLASFYFRVRALCLYIHAILSVAGRWRFLLTERKTMRGQCRFDVIALDRSDLSDEKEPCTRRCETGGHNCMGGAPYEYRERAPPLLHP